MKKTHKDFLKKLLISSVASIGLPSQAAEIPFFAINKEDNATNNSKTNDIISKVNSGVLSPMSETIDISGHTSHASHSSHTSHTSHSSSSSSSPGGGSHIVIGSGTTNHGSSNTTTLSHGSSKGLTIGAAVAAPIAIYVIIKSLINSSEKNKRIKAQKLEGHYEKYYYGSRDIYPSMFGKDVDEMIDSLVSLGCMNKSDIKHFSYSHIYRQSKTSKKCVEKMYNVMGIKAKKYASTSFLANLKSWKEYRKKKMSLLTENTINLVSNIEALHAVAILLVENGYLNNYEITRLDDIDEKEKILSAYHKFLKQVGKSKSNYINPTIFALLYKS